MFGIIKEPIKPNMFISLSALVRQLLVQSSYCGCVWSKMLFLSLYGHLQKIVVGLCLLTIG